MEQGFESAALGSVSLMALAELVFTGLLHPRSINDSCLHLRTNDELVMFLSKYRDKNFLKSHGRDNAR